MGFFKLILILDAGVGFHFQMFNSASLVKGLRLKFVLSVVATHEVYYESPHSLRNPSLQFFLHPPYT